MNFLHNLTSYMDAATLLEAFGPWVIGGIGLVVFIESGVLFPFLPGDSLLVAAGTAEMPYKKFIGWNVSGAVAWVLSMNLVGVFLGNIPGIADSIEKIMLLIIALSVAPILIKAVHSYVTSKKKATVMEEAEPINSRAA